VVDAYLLSRFPRRDYQLINLGLSSETVSGLTEPDHPFPRPNLLDRLGRALRLVAPDVVVACYGMNDGIYRPFSKRRFEAFRSGINQLIKKVKAAGAELVLMTPPPFDPAAVEEKLASEDAQGNGYKAPYRNYDEVLGRYATWIRQQAGRVAQVVDLHGAISERLTARRQQDPDYTLTRDGVHPVAFGHWLIARELLRAWDAPGLGPLPGTERELKKLKKKDAPARFMKLVRRRQDLLSNAWLARVGHQRPGDYEALPLEEAKRQAAQLEKQIRVKRDAARQAGL
jgi:lysophospholipase L1-like esterase